MNKTVRLQIAVDVELGAESGIDCISNTESLERHLNYGNEWDNGRHPFSSEMLAESLSQQIRKAVFQVVYDYMVVKHGPHTMRSYDQGSINVAYDEATKFMASEYNGAYVNLETLEFKVG